MKLPYKTVEGTCGGVPIFPGSRLPVYFLIDYIDSDTSLDEFEDNHDIDMSLVESLLMLPLTPDVRPEPEGGADPEQACYH